MEPTLRTSPVTMGADGRRSWVTLNDTRRLQAAVTGASGFFLGLLIGPLVFLLTGLARVDENFIPMGLLAVLGAILAGMSNLLFAVVMRQSSNDLAREVSRVSLAIISGAMPVDPPVPGRAGRVVPAPRDLLTALYGWSTPAPAISVAVMTVVPPNAPSRFVAVLTPYGVPAPKTGAFYSVVVAQTSPEVGVLVGPLHEAVAQDPRWAQAQTAMRAAGGWWWSLGWTLGALVVGIGVASLLLLL